MTYQTALVLEALAAGRHHGWDIMDATDLPSGTVYPILRRFEEQGLIQSTWNTDGPRPRKYYQTTRRGAQLLKDMESQWNELAASVKKLLAANGRK